MRYQTPTDPIEVASELTQVYSAVFAEPPYNEGPEQVKEFAAIYARQAARPGFGIVLARDEQAGSPLVGFTYGIAQQAGWWWRHCDRPAPAEVVGAPLFAIYEWGVLPAYRHLGIGRSLLVRLLNGRPEPWATLSVNPAADAYQIYKRRGWRQVGTCRRQDWPAMAVMVCPL